MINKKLRVLWWSDSPTGSTGFGTVARNLLKELSKTEMFEFDILGINYDGTPYNHDTLPYRIHPATSGINQRYNDPYGRMKLMDMLGSAQFDILWMLQDTFNLLSIIKQINELRDKLPKDKKFVTIFYFPIDAPPKKDWVNDVIAKIDFPVAYTQYGKRECITVNKLLKDMDVIYHGVNTEDFKPVSEEQIKDFLDNHFVGIKGLSNRYLILNVNRNQIRKDYYRTFAAFYLFKKQVSDACLMCLCKLEDQGGNLFNIAEYFGLKYAEDWFAPMNYSIIQGYPVQTVNLLYNSARMVISTSLGEGWGLSSIEALAARRPIVFPNNTSLPEIVGENNDRGILVKSGKSFRDMAYFGAVDNSFVRPAVDPYEFAEAMLSIHDNPKMAESMAEAGYTWAQNNKWSIKAEEWVKVFKKAEEKLHQIRGI